MKDKNKTIKLVSQIVGVAALAISVGLSVVYYLGINNEVSLNNNVDMMIKWTVLLVGIAILFAFLLGPIISVLSNPKSLFKGVISIGVLAAIFIVAYVLAKADVSTVDLYSKVDNLEGKLKFTETGLIALYIVVGLTILAVVFSEIKSLLKL